MRPYLDRDRTAVWLLATLANLLIVAGFAAAAPPTTPADEAAVEPHVCPGDVDGALLADVELEPIWTPRLPFLRRDEVAFDLGPFRLTFGMSAHEPTVSRPSARQPAMLARLAELEESQPIGDAATTSPTGDISLAAYTEDGTPLQHTPGEAIRDILEIRKQLGPAVQGTMFDEAAGAGQQQQMLQALAQEFRHCHEEDGAPSRICRPTVHAASFPVAPLPESAVWAMPVASFPMPLLGTDAALLRDVAEQLESAANQLERAERYERADQLRQVASELRTDARRLKSAPCEHCGANCQCGPGKSCGAEGCRNQTKAAARCEHCGDKCTCASGKHCGAEGCVGAAAVVPSADRSVSDARRRGPCGADSAWIVTLEPSRPLLPPRIVQPPMDALIEAFSVEKAVEQAAESQAEYAELVRELQALCGDLAGHLNRPTLPLTEPEATSLRQTVRRLRHHVRELK